MIFGFNNSCGKESHGDETLADSFYQKKQGMKELIG